MHRSLLTIVALSCLVPAGCGAPPDVASESAALEPHDAPLVVEEAGTSTVAEGWEAPDLAPDSPAEGADDSAPFRFGFAFVIHAGEPMVVLGRSSTRAGAAAEVVSADDAWFEVRRRRVAEAFLEDEARSWLGQQVVLHGAAGRKCEASIAEPWLVDRNVRGDGEDVAVQTLIAAALVVSPDCGEVNHATPLTFPSRVYSRVDPTTLPAEAQQVRRALVALRALPEYTALQAEYERGEWSAEGPPPAGSFERHEESGTTVTFFVEPGGRRLALATVWAGAGCGGFQANLSAAFEETPSGLVARAVEPGSSAIPERVVESGGALVMLHEDWATLPASGETVDVRPPVFSCGC